ncbi:MAG: LEA type 2 family protein [Desulfosudaceae bacterium]
MLEESGMWQKPEASIGSITVSALNFEGAGLDVAVEVHNPNAYQIRLGRLDYALTVQDKQVLSGQQEENTALKAEQSQTIVFPVKIRFADLLAAVSGLKQQNIVNYGLTGGITAAVPMVGDIRLPFSRQGRLPVPKMPQVTVEGLHLDSINMLGASLKLALSLENPNNFSVNLDQFDYAFKLNNNAVAGGKAPAALQAGPGQTSRIELPLDLSFASAGLALYQALTGGREMNYELNVDGRADTSHKLLTRFPFQTNKSGTVQLQR